MSKELSGAFGHFSVQTLVSTLVSHAELELIEQEEKLVGPECSWSLFSDTGD